MGKLRFYPSIEGFAFSNSWHYDDVEKTVLHDVISSAVGAVEIVMSPLILAAGGPVLLAELGVPFIGPWLVAKTIEAANDALVSSIMGAVTAKSFGLCGGMVFAALDYWTKHWVVPRGTASNDQPTRATPQGNELRSYIWERLLDGLRADAGTFLQWMAALHFGQPSWLRDRTAEQLVSLRQRIDAGQPVPVGLVGTTLNPLDNHQILIYGYENQPGGTVKLFAYDPNFPDKESVLELDFTQDHLATLDEPDPGARGPLRGLFCTTYSPRVPPRTLVLRSSLVAVPSTLAQISQSVQLRYDVANVGYHASPSGALAVVDQRGTIGAEASSSLGEGEQRTVTAQLTPTRLGTDWVVPAVVFDGPSGSKIVKSIAPENHADRVTLRVVEARQITTVVAGHCKIANAPGAHVTFKTELADLGPIASIEWFAENATPTTGTGETFTVDLPAEALAPVQIRVAITTREGGVIVGALAFKTITALQETLERALCQMAADAMHEVPFAPDEIQPPGPSDGPGWRFSKERMRELIEISRSLERVATLALDRGEEIERAPVLRPAMPPALHVIRTPLPR